ncbi:MAG: ImmA/IrrE family metallo-endopeptidase [Nitrospira sp.]|nr:ImmA/IrrE family metallo-endopeptidase [Nitrospira sp.]
MAQALGVDAGVVRQIEEGTLDPLPGDYVLIAARVLLTDFRYFISIELDSIEEETRRVYRALSQPKPSDLFAIRRFMAMSLAEAELENLLGIHPQSLPPYYPPANLRRAKHIDQAINAAHAERVRLKLGNAPVSNIFDIARSQGCRLLRHVLEDSAVSGLTVMHPTAGISVLVNYDDDIYRQFFSAAHEYAHVLFDRETIQKSGCVVSYSYSGEELIELRANRFAAHFLLPPTALERYDRPRTVAELTTTIRTVALDYRVNTATVVYRMHEAGWITERTSRSFSKKKPVKIGRKEKRDPDLPEGLTEAQRVRRERAIQTGVSSRLLELLRTALIDGQITFGRFAEILDLTVDAADEFVRATGVAL